MIEISNVDAKRIVRAIKVVRALDKLVRLSSSEMNDIRLLTAIERRLKRKLEPEEKE